MSTGNFKEIVFLEDNKEYSEADIKIEPSLTKMEWGVPNYQEILNKAFVTSFLTGGIGGMIYGSTKTDVYGNTNLYVKIVEKSTSKIIIEKEYKGHFILIKQPTNEGLATLPRHEARY